MHCPSCNRDLPADARICPACGASLADGQREFEAELRALLGQGRKIDAIKRYRERSGVGLSEAKNAVEALERGEAPRSGNRMEPNLEQDLLVLLERGKKIDAIRRYRQATGVGLKEAKEAVEALAAECGLTAAGRSGCLGMIALVVAVMALLARLSA